MTIKQTKFKQMIFERIIIRVPRLVTCSSNPRFENSHAGRELDIEPSTLRPITRTYIHVASLTRICASIIPAICKVHARGYKRIGRLRRIHDDKWFLPLEHDLYSFLTNHYSIIVRVV